MSASLYIIGVSKLKARGHRWPVTNTLSFFVLGLGSFAWVQFGFLGTYSADLRLAFTTRIALLLFAVPLLVNLGKPLALLQISSGLNGQRRLKRVLASRPVRIISNAILAPILALTIFMLFITPISAQWRVNPTAQALTTVLTPMLGLILVLPFASQAKHRTSLFITAEFILAFVELMLDAIPGVVMSINNVVLDGARRVAAGLPSWAPLPLHDQHLAGNLLWGIAELSDVPILVALFIRWSRQDKREAKKIDDLTDEEMDALLAEHLKGPRR